ncbi:hypothetical protein ACVQ9Z_02975 [Staphylococcus aureus]
MQTVAIYSEGDKDALHTQISPMKDIAQAPHFV